MSTSGRSGRHGAGPRNRRRPHARHALLAGAIGAALAVGVASGSVATATSATGSGLGAGSALERGVVDITTRVATGQETLQGTGMVLSRSGIVLTNNHVIAGAGAITVTDVATGRRYPAVVLGTDLADDVALLQLRGASRLEPVLVGDSAGVAVGQAVEAAGNAGGVGGRPSITSGRVTALRRALTVTDEAGQRPERLSGLIEVDAQLAPGDSGGPLLTRAGRVVGMNTAASFSLQLGAISGTGYSIPIDRALAIARQIQAGRASARVHVGPSARLGVQVVAVDAMFQPTTSSGAVVAGVVPGTPAAEAGLQEGDVIVSLGERGVGSPTGLANLMQLHHPGEQVALGWLDQTGRQQSTVVQLIAGPPA
jgi:S1-C subfamily serine protease